jgi:GNAT superfamily N-acetyltransferase
MRSRVRFATPDDVPEMVALQRACFPAPFPEELLWNAAHLARHLQLFPEGQFVVFGGPIVIASASNTIISEENYVLHADWDATVGGPFLSTFDANGSTLYGLDISVHPNYRGKGIAKQLYRARFEFVRVLRLARYATGCRVPDFHAYAGSLEDYVQEVARGERIDRTLTPLLKMGLRVIGVHPNYMEDEESRNGAALLEWKP